MIGTAIQERMTQLRLTRPALAKASRLSVTQIAKAERGELPKRVANLDTLGRALLWSVGWDEALRSGKRPKSVADASARSVSLEGLTDRDRFILLGLVEAMRTAPNE